MPPNVMYSFQRESMLLFGYAERNSPRQRADADFVASSAELGEDV
ncbi:hypothetical protein [Candidatus Methanomethylophilus sp. 1R26]|nr:hypothetical protein [Candidatus Methanomethylophilus sp. 1R26]